MTKREEQEAIRQARESDRDVVWFEDGKVRHSYAEDFEAMFARQKIASGNALQMVIAALDFWLLHLVGDKPSDGAVETWRNYTLHANTHIKEYRRLPQRRDIPPAHRHLGAKVDRVMLQSSELLLSALDLIELPEKLAARRALVERTERRRKERIEARRKAKILSPREMSPPPVPVEKRAKLAEAPRCDKCGKRPRVTGTLCEKCAKWMMNR